MMVRSTSAGLDNLLLKVLEFLSFQRCQPMMKTRESKAFLSPFETVLRKCSHHDQKESLATSVTGLKPRAPNTSC
jgi:hypothetical protein